MTNTGLSPGWLSCTSREGRQDGARQYSPRAQNLTSDIVFTHLFRCFFHPKVAAFLPITELSPILYRISFLDGQFPPFTSATHLRILGSSVELRNQIEVQQMTSETPSHMWKPYDVFVKVSISAGQRKVVRVRILYTP